MQSFFDSGCSRTVCGKSWLELYLDTLDEAQKAKLIYEKTDAVYRFGDGKKFTAKHSVKLPCVLAGKSIAIKTDVVNCNIPLLLSKSSMKTAGMVIDMNDDTVTVFGKRVSLSSTSMGHYVIPIHFSVTPARIETVIINFSELNK